MKEIKLDFNQFIKEVDFPHETGRLGGIIGRYQSAFKGRGIEFEGFRAYSHDDDSSLIDWKASSRSQEILVREFTEERNLNVFFIMDVSNSMLYGSINKLKCEYAAELIATLGFAALYSEDSVGLCMINDKIVKTVPLNNGNTQNYILRNVLSNPRLYGGKFDLGYGLKYVSHFLERNSILIIVSDFIGFKKEWIKYLKIIAKKYVVIGIDIKDKLDKELPKDIGEVVFSDPFTNKKEIVKVDKINDDYMNFAEERSREIKNIFAMLKMDFVEFTTDKPFLVTLSKFFKETAKRWI